MNCSRRFLLIFSFLLNLGAVFAQFNPGEFDVDGEQEKPRVPRFRLDYTMRFLLMNQTKNLVTNDPVADHDWLYKSPGHQFSLSILPGFRENWTVGVSFYFQRLLDERDNFSELLPYDQFPYGYLKDPIQFRRNVRVYGNSLIGERRLYSTPMEEFRVFVRGEAGFLRYSAKAEIGRKIHQDSTYKFESYSKAQEVSTVFSGSMGVGAQYQRGHFGASVICGYQLQTAHSFLPRNQFNEWKAVYHPENYSGTPSDDEFSIDKDDIPDNKARFSQLYLQVSVLLFLGEPWK